MSLNEEFEQLLFGQAPIGLVLADDRVIKACNTHFARMFGYTVSDLIEQEFSILYPSFQEFISIGERVNNHPDITNYWDERIMMRQDKSMFWCRVRCRVFEQRERLKRAAYSFDDLSKERSVAQLTPRERDVVSLLAEGRSSKEIAIRLELSYRTIEIYRAKLLKKYNVNSTPALLNCLSKV